MVGDSARIRRFALITRNPSQASLSRARSPESTREPRISGTYLIAFRTDEIKDKCRWRQGHSLLDCANVPLSFQMQDDPLRGLLRRDFGSVDRDVCIRRLLYSCQPASLLRSRTTCPPDSTRKGTIDTPRAQRGRRLCLHLSGQNPDRQGRPSSDSGQIRIARAASILALSLWNAMHCHPLSVSP